MHLKTAKTILDSMSSIMYWKHYFQKSYLNQRKILTKIHLKSQANIIRRKFPFLLISYLGPIVIYYSSFNPKHIYYIPFICLALF